MGKSEEAEVASSTDGATMDESPGGASPDAPTADAGSPDDGKSDDETVALSPQVEEALKVLTDLVALSRRDT
jgi:hypothetical protein